MPACRRFTYRAARPSWRALMSKLLVIVGSTRPGRAADLVVPWVTSRARAHGGFDVEVADLRDWPLPIFPAVPLRNTVVIPFVRPPFGAARDPSYPQPVTP